MLAFWVLCRRANASLVVTRQAYRVGFQRTGWNVVSSHRRYDTANFAWAKLKHEIAMKERTAS